MPRLKYYYYLLVGLLVTLSTEKALASFPGVNDPKSLKPRWFEGGGDGDEVNTALDTLLGRVLDTLFLVLSAVAVLLLIHAGILYITAGGDPTKVKRARQSIINILVGIILLVTSYAIISFLIGLAAYFAAASGAG